MSSIVRQKVGKHTYLYESVSFRDAEGRPRNKRTTIGKLDPVTGQPLYKPEYVERMRQAGTPIDESEPPTTFTIEDIRKSSVREPGSFYLLEKIGQECGLIKALQKSIPEHWREILGMMRESESLCSVPVVLVSANLETDEEIPGADAVVKKPFQLTELTEIVARLL